MSIEIYNPEHPHHEVWYACVSSLYNHEGPLKLQYRNVSDEPWEDLINGSSGQPLISWSTFVEYRIKPIEKEMITKTITYPAPLSVAPKLGGIYWVVINNVTLSYSWSNDQLDIKWLKEGICYDNELDARKAYNALQCL